MRLMDVHLPYYYYHGHIYRINQMIKFIASKPHIISKIISLAYSIFVVWVSFNILVFSPLWLPVYIFFTSTSRTIKTIKNIYQLLSSMFIYKMTQPITYAILKGNGKYLKSIAPNVYIHQLYDYTVRKFLTLPDIDPESNLVELECDHPEGIEFLKNSSQLTKVSALSSSYKISQNLQKRFKLSAISTKCTKYEIHQFSNLYDCMILFNLKQKIRMQRNSEVEILKVLTYVRYHLENSGYFIFGQFLEQGEIGHLQQLFKMYSFNVVSVEDLTKNYRHSRKIIENTCFIYFQDKALNYIKEKVEKYIYQIDRTKSFYVYVLEKQ